MNLLRNKPQPNYSIEETLQILEGPFLFIKKNWNTLSIKELSKETGLTKPQIEKLVRGRLNKKKWITRVAGHIIPGITVLNNETGIYYDSLSSCAMAYNINVRTFIKYVYEKPAEKYSRFIVIKNNL